MKVHMLARFLQLEDDEAITKAIQELNKLPIPANYVNLLDKYNIPFLIDFNALGNDLATRMMKQHSAAKEVQLAQEVPIVLKGFYDAIMEALEGKDLPNHIHNVLSVMLHMDDSEYVRTALRLWNDLDLELDDLEELVPHLQRIREQYPEADVLMRKIESFQLELDEDVDVDVELDMEDEEDAAIEIDLDFDEDVEEDDDFAFFPEAHDFFLSDLDESFLSDESGIESGSEDEEEEDEEDTEERFKHYDITVAEVHTKILSFLIKTGDPQRIAFGIQMARNVDIPLFAYRKYEITSLISEYAPYEYEALKLWNEIDRMEDVELAEENLALLNYLEEIIGSQSTFSRSMFRILANDMKYKDKEHMVRVVQLFIDNDIPLEFFQKSGVKEFLLEYDDKTAADWILIFKIRQMENRVCKPF
uniref:DNA primase n=1 Tax=Caenorhabditis tropicalis TaxID=1561998 RepID=A0A1I7TYI5_9PELO